MFIEKPLALSGSGKDFYGTCLSMSTPYTKNNGAASGSALYTQICNLPAKKPFFLSLLYKFVHISILMTPVITITNYFTMLLERFEPPSI